ncbi:MAG: hypothetical protein EBR09_12755, partial [Proteobacteria bacterium]|nr:hypothetical protein [Pseudomonadota bacterium]
TARQLFTVVEDADDNVWTLNTITRDVDTAVSYALDLLGARGRPDLACVGVNESVDVDASRPADEALGQFLTTEGVVDFAKSMIVRWGTLEPTLSVAQYNAEIEKQEIPDVSGEFSVHRDVRAWLVGDAAAKNWVKLTLKELLEQDLVTERDPELVQPVNATEVHWSMYEFKSLDDIAFRAHEVLGAAKLPTYGEYVSREACGLRGSPRRRGFFLREPEFSVRKATFATCAEAGQLNVFTCETLASGVHDYLSRRELGLPFLRRRELLFLVLVLVQGALRNLVVGSIEALHVPRAGWQEVSELFEDEGLGPAADPLRIAEIKEINALMNTLSESGAECKGASVDLGEVTNVQHLLLAQCAQEMREEVGWVIPGRAAGGAHSLALPAPARLLLGGFYPAFAALGAGAGAGAPATFLRDLLGATSSADAPLTGRVCFGRDEQGEGSAAEGAVHVMHPFWGEFFDVAHSGSSVMEAGRRAHGCDMRRSGPDNSLLVFSTLCGETTGGGQDVCARHPHYLQELRSTLPEECAALDGSAVHRGQLGAMLGTLLCERQPDVSAATCESAHGLLHGRVGRAVEDLADAEDVAAVQEGLWRRSSSLFRGAEDAALAEEATALRLLEHDIGGHRLHFRVSAEGVLRLESVLMRSEPPAGAQAPVAWLAEAEADFAEQHQLYEFLRAAPRADGAQVSWRCPLHWMQTFVSDDGHDQARAPVAARNEARFAHITGEARFAHPTVRYSSKVSGLRAARFVSEALACVGPSAECHGAELLERSVDAVVAQHRAWHVVEYVGAETCARVLDWPDIADAQAARP